MAYSSSISLPDRLFAALNCRIKQDLKKDITHVENDIKETNKSTDEASKVMNMMNKTVNDLGILYSEIHHSHSSHDKRCR